MYMAIIPTWVIEYKGNNITGGDGEDLKIRVRWDSEFHGDSNKLQNIIDSLIYSNVTEFTVKVER